MLHTFRGDTHDTGPANSFLFPAIHNYYKIKYWRCAGTRGDGLDELDGKRIFDTFSSGAQQAIDNQDHLNRINVFPAHDGIQRIT